MLFLKWLKLKFEFFNELNSDSFLSLLLKVLMTLHDGHLFYKKLAEKKYLKREVLSKTSENGFWLKIASEEFWEVAHAIKILKFNIGENGQILSLKFFSFGSNCRKNLANYVLWDSRCSPFS